MKRKLREAQVTYLEACPMGEIPICQVYRLLFYERHGVIQMTR